MPTHRPLPVMWPPFCDRSPWSLATGLDLEVAGAVRACAAAAVRADATGRSVAAGTAGTAMASLATWFASVELSVLNVLVGNTVLSVNLRTPV